MARPQCPQGTRYARGGWQSSRRNDNLDDPPRNAKNWGGDELSDVLVCLVILLNVIKMAIHLARWPDDTGQVATYTSYPPGHPDHLAPIGTIALSCLASLQATFGDVLPTLFRLTLGPPLPLPCTITSSSACPSCHVFLKFIRHGCRTPRPKCQE